MAEMVSKDLGRLIRSGWLGLDQTPTKGYAVVAIRSTIDGMDFILAQLILDR
jgi:hypothetical protein